MEFPIPFSKLFVGLLGIYFLYHLYHTYYSYNQRRSKIFAPKVPGAWPIIGHLRQFNNNKPLRQTLGDMADKHGPAFMIQRGMKQILVVSSWEVAKECLTTNDLAFASRPQTSIGKYMLQNNAGFVVAPYGSLWREMKVRLARGELVSPRTLEMVKHQRLSESNAFIKELYCYSKDQITKVVICEMIFRLAMNIMTKTINGRRAFDTFGATNDEGERLSRVINELIDASGLIVLSDLIPLSFLEWLDPQGHIKTLKRIGKEFASIVQGWIDEHRKRRLVNGPKSDQDFIDFTLSAIENGSLASEYATDSNIKAAYETLMVAGSSTVPITIIWALSLLLNNEHALKHVQRELDEKVGKDRWVEEFDIETLSYLQAIINETLRLYPPGPQGFPHEAREDCCVNGYHIPKGTRLIINMWKLQRDSRVWIEPEKFMPERFLTSDESCNALKYHFQCFPFGLGRRACPGMPLAQKVVHLTMARLLQGFNLSKPMDMPVDMSEKNGVLLYKALPLEVSITPRLHPKLYQEM
ncbi:hypothetical protein Ancab_039708 [Ancistrocladus abbreviatus]